MTETKRRALVLGGTGHVGAEVLRALSGAGLEVAFSYCQGEGRARALAEGLGQRAVRVDFRERGALGRTIEALAAEGFSPSVLVHCAAVVRGRPIDAATDEDWDETLAINARSAFEACRALGARMAAAGGGSIVLTGALDRAQSLPVPSLFAASQGFLATLTMAAAKELGPRGVRVNMVALGLLEGGLSQALSPALREEYKAFSALRRFGTASEAARVITWLALHEGYMNGKVLGASGGI